jgi:hypothetical protein
MWWYWQFNDNTIYYGHDAKRGSKRTIYLIKSMNVFKYCSACHGYGLNISLTNNIFGNMCFDFWINYIIRARSMLKGCTILNLYESTWVHMRGIDLDLAVLHIYTIKTFRTGKYSRILTLNIYLKWNTFVYKDIYTYNLSYTRGVLGGVMNARCRSVNTYIIYMCTYFVFHCDSFIWRWRRKVKGSRIRLHFCYS